MTRPAAMLAVFALGTGACGDDWGDAPCPELPALEMEERELLGRANIYELYLAGRPERTSKDVEKETVAARLFADIPSPESVDLRFESVRCEGGVCVVVLLYEQTDRSASQTWVSDAMEATGHFLMSEEHCGTYFPGRLRLRERSCGVFEQTLFLDCRPGG